MDSSTENMDAVARAIRRIITFTQGGGEVNIIMADINVGRPYWTAEATMLQHPGGILIMTPVNATVMTGKMSLDYSGGVSREDNFGQGGYDRVGPHGEVQYWASNPTAATEEVPFAGCDHADVAPDEWFPRRAGMADADTSVVADAHLGGTRC